ncbi:transcription-repair coupling factor [Candidatus Parabeggiatoa sp. HSG14]|uniref:transcription-repair coupling factor n=1 Tax=Candidatus Parabeggiatoa sp. HSG14 TaxID=3055593 RepID=UPI0025A82CA5|nr:transcription-repair coupling factor [Thiotrichales bacterium HSG14]
MTNTTYLNPLHPNLTCKSGQRQDWGNLYGSSAGLVISLVAQQAPLIIITPDSLSAQRLVEDIQFYAAEDLPLLSFPDWETLPYDMFSPHQDIISERLTTLYHLPDIEYGVLVLPVNTLMYRLAPTDYVRANSLLVTTGQRLNTEKLRQRLEHTGYRCVSQVMEHGEFAVRGSLLDLFPMGSDVPYRIDLFDDEVDSIRRFDPDNQRSEKTIEEIRLLPAREFPLTKASIEQFRHQWRNEFNGDPIQCPMYTEVRDGLPPAGIEYYLPLFFEQTHTLFDYLPTKSVIVTLQGVLETAEQFWQEANERYEQLRHNIERPILPPAQLFLQANQVFAALHDYSHIPLYQDKTDKIGGINFATRPPPSLPIDARSPKPLIAFNDFLEAFQGRVLITAETTGRRESLLELLNKYDLVPKVVEDWQTFLHEEVPLCLTVAPLDQGLLLEEILSPSLSKEGTNALEEKVVSLKKGKNQLSFFEEDTAISSKKVKEKSTAIPFEKRQQKIFSLAVITESQLFGERVVQRRLRKKAVQRDTDAIVRDLTELNIGAPVVHEAHGVGRYQGLVTLELSGIKAEFLQLEYAKQKKSDVFDKLYVPVSSLHLISRFTGMDPEHAPLHRLGSVQWEKAKQKAAKQAKDVAVELLDIYAKRATRQGHLFKIEHANYQAFAEGFPFEETPDQIDAIEAVLENMSSIQPMDRLICGDVGFGKTEVAMRAAFVATMDGQQVAILVPTTLLAQQHYQTFQDRFADWPIQVEQLSRFRSQKQQTETLKAVAEGKVDIVIGTHKLLQKNIKFNKLGLVVIDEEHRFGVKQKEKFKSLRAEVDILTLTATPIPRSLNMALSNLRDLSVIATPPARRLAVKTFVREWQAPVIVEAILRELKRGGQVYFLHNDIDTINGMARKVEELVPEARVQVAHGKMRERELEKVMQDFYHRRFNVLVCTTIIETGIDVPSANTIVINRADKLGLAQLYQLRGRVGRSHHRAYAYLITPPRNAMSKDAQKRITAIDALEELGMGFTLATHDLEIRGAGEMLGSEQSGHIQEVGYTLYSELLERAVNAIKSGESFDRPLSRGTEVNLYSTALLPSDYMPDIHTRLIMYKRIANAPTERALDDVQIEMIDRFGLLPEYAKALILITEIKLKATPLGIRKIDFGTNGGTILFDEKTTVEPLKIINLIQTQPNHYRLDGEQKLHLLMELPKFSARCKVLETLLKQLKS